MPEIEQPQPGPEKRRSLPHKTILGRGDDGLETIRRQTELKTTVLPAWVNERGPLHPAEMAARRIVAEAIKKDIKDLERGKQTVIPEIDEAILGELTVLMGQPEESDGDTKIKRMMVLTEDSNTREPQRTEIIETVDQEGKSTWIAQEISEKHKNVPEEKRIISRTMICPEDRTSFLTLDYKDRRYEGRNPNIHNHPQMPRGASEMFDLLATATIKAKRKERSEESSR